MKKYVSALLSLALAAALVTVGACAAGEDVTEIHLSDRQIIVDGSPIPEEETAAVYAANDIVYYEAGHDFTYGEGTAEDEHTPEEAQAHTVVHITRPGTYSLSGTLSAGQIAVDLGKDAEEDPEAVVTLILNGVDVTCTVAPAVIFYNVYECGDKDAPSMTVDTSAAGANVVIADGTKNTVNGAYVARIYKSYTLSEDGTEVVDSKKLHKYDAAFYSKMSMNVDGGEKGTGILTIDAENEGLDSELHLTINGGTINIESGNDGINTNEDGVSVTTVNGGCLTINVTGETGEGDGIDSNGWLVINGGMVIAAACSASADAGIDSDMGIHINGGTVLATGHMLDRIESGGQTYAVFNFAGRQSGDDVVSLRNEKDEEVMALWPINDYSVLIYSAPELTEGDYTLWSDGQQMAAAASAAGMGGFGMGGQRPGGMELPEGVTPPEGFDPSAMERPEGVRWPEGMEMPEPPAGFVPGGMEPPEGFIPPEGFGGMMPGGRPGGRDEAQKDALMTKVFPVEEGANMFSRVAPADEASSDLPFGDVRPGDWCYDAILWGYKAGVVNGKTTRNFDTNGGLNRGQAAAMLYRMAGEPAAEGNTPFSDVTAEDWCGAAVAWAAEEGILLGYGDGSFRPWQPVTRQQLAAMLWRFAKAEGMDVSTGENTNILSYTDAFDIAEYAVPALQWACGSGVMDGYGDGSLGALDGATRAQTVTILQRYGALKQ